jgi:hypothetical protein
MSRRFTFNNSRYKNILSTGLHRCYTDISAYHRYANCFLHANICPGSSGSLQRHDEAEMLFSLALFVGRRWRCGSMVPTVVGSTSRVLRPLFLHIRVNKDEQIEFNYIRHTTTV